MSVHVLFNLLNELGKRDTCKMRGLQSTTEPCVDGCGLTVGHSLIFVTIC